MEMVVLEFVEDWPGPAVVVSLDQVRPLLDGPDLWDTKTGASLPYPVPQCLLSPAYISYPTRPHWPQQRLFDARLGIVAQAGIINKLDSDMWIKLGALGFLHRGPAVSSSASHAPTAEEPRPLGLSALHEPAIVLCVGALAAAVAFLVEKGLSMHASRVSVRSGRLFLRLRPAAPTRWAVHAY
ncbi:hypothetical protein R5R35_000861 [Gryllus longicercus]|uniref:Uncharacterized protein n=1 Tax=Gryllus longicercus TaxID=2509291 RepID=A0AAN9VJA6_9ORTH